MSRIINKAVKILNQPVCDHCLGRQFAQLLHGYSNNQRGKIIRTMIAMLIDSGNINLQKIDVSNLYPFEFHNEEIKKLIKRPRTKKCSVCNNIFEKLTTFKEKIKKKIKSNMIEFDTFLIGTKLPFSLIEKEEQLWEKVGIDFCEPLKAELNREIGKIIEHDLKKRYDMLRPDINFIVDIEKNKIELIINPLFIYGEYQKLKRGIPQTRWPSGKYRISIEEIIAKPFIALTKGKEHKLHGQGREDIDARCLAWRPFVLEIIKPKKRKIKLDEVKKKIPRYIKLRKLRASCIDEVREIKSAKPDKEYKMVVHCSRRIKKQELRKLKSLIGEIRQRTPLRVIHRRADKIRKKKLKKIKARFINSKNFLLRVRCEAGLYVKEFIDGDGGRTKPSVSQILDCACECKDLDVVKIYK